MALGQKVELQVAGSDDPITVTYDAVDLRRYEQQFHQSVLVEPMSLTMLTYLGWSAARRSGALNGSFTKWEAFDEACTSVRALAGDDADPPTKARKRAASTSKAPSEDSSSA